MTKLRGSIVLGHLPNFTAVSAGSAAETASDFARENSTVPSSANSRACALCLEGVRLEISSANASSDAEYLAAALAEKSGSLPWSSETKDASGSSASGRCFLGKRKPGCIQLTGLLVCVAVRGLRPVEVLAGAFGRIAGTSLRGFLSWLRRKKYTLPTR